MVYKYGKSSIHVRDEILIPIRESGLFSSRGEKKLIKEIVKEIYGEEPDVVAEYYSEKEISLRVEHFIEWQLKVRV